MHLERLDAMIKGKKEFFERAISSCRACSTKRQTVHVASLCARVSVPGMAQGNSWPAYLKSRVNFLGTFFNWILYVHEYLSAADLGQDICGYTNVFSLIKKRALMAFQHTFTGKFSNYFELLSELLDFFY